MSLPDSLIAYFRAGGPLADLETFIGTLPLVNAGAYKRLSLFLMAAYRQAGQEAAAQRVRQPLLVYYGHEPAVETRVAYADVLAHLTQAPPQRLTAADSTTLVRLANSPGGYAAVACATLHQFYPALGCGSPPPPARTSTGSLAAAPQTARLEAPHPNPAASVVTVAYALPTGQTTGRLLLCDLRTGKVVLEQVLTAAQGAATLTVASLPEGL